jgi:hypothetical protein
LIIKAREHNENNLSTLSLKTLELVKEDWGNKYYEDILDYTTRTIPYLSTRYREPIVWNLIRPYGDLKYALSFSERVQIHKFVEEYENTTFKLHTYGNLCPVSINEVAEIYLALCGELPDKAPSQSAIGFNLQTVLSAFDKLRDKNKNGIMKSFTEIDSAVLLTDLLLNSLSFRSYSIRVALITGLLFLTKLGYSFIGDVLEDNWPDGNSHEILKEWFNKVSIKVDPRQMNSKT